MALPRKPRAVLFDMDGLIFNSETLSFEASVSAAAQVGHHIDWAFFKTLVGRNWTSIREMMIAHLGPSFLPEAFREIWLAHYGTLLEARLELKAGMIRLIETLEHLNIPRAVATSSPPEKAQYKLGKFALVDRFDHVVAAGDYAESKPAPDPFLKAASLLEMAPEDCIALEDSHNGIRSAHAAGAMAIMVPDLLEPTDDIRALCTHVLDDLHAVADLVVRAYD